MKFGGRDGTMGSKMGRKIALNMANLVSIPAYQAPSGVTPKHCQVWPPKNSGQKHSTVGRKFALNTADPSSIPSIPYVL